MIFGIKEFSRNSKERHSVIGFRGITATTIERKRNNPP
jgi:hypothetical protein